MAATILMADDNPCDILEVERVLRKARISNPLCAVRDGLELIAYLQGEGAYGDRILYPYPAIVLLDLKMPRKSGLEVLEWLRTGPEHQELGVIVLTALEDLDELRRAYQLGAHSFLAKPIGVADFHNLATGLKGIALESNPDGQYLKFNTKLFRRLA